MNVKDLSIGMIVFHKEVYDYREPLEVIGILEDKVRLKGDFSGGTHNVSQSGWFSLEGLSIIYNYEYKLKCREYINNIKDNINNEEKDEMIKIISNLTDIVSTLTYDVELNK
jgi:hypothetical protein